MKTEVIMKRELLGLEIRQKSKSGFFNAKDLIEVGNQYRRSIGKPIVILQQYFNLESSKEFMNALEKEYGTIKVSGKGRNSNGIWVHPLLFMDIALWVNPELKVKVYQWFLDNLLKFRNSSGDSFKLMAGAIFSNPNFNKSFFTKTIQKISNRIALECGVDLTDKDKWQKATEKQLKLRDKMHEYIAIASDMTSNLDMAVDFGINKAKEAINIGDII